MTTRRPASSLDLSEIGLEPSAPAPKRRRGKLAKLYRLARALCVLASVLLVTWVGAALVGAGVASPWWRALIPFSVAFIIPWAVRFLVRRRLRRRTGRRLQLGGWWMYVGWNAALLALLCLGFGAVTGRALRRRGDGWMGEASGPIAAALRRQIARAATYMERFDVPAELRGPSGPVTQPDVIAPGEPPRPAPAPSKAAAWVHPLPGQRRLPPNASCRFGARRPGRRPAECQLGHCGVDLAGPVGLPVVAIAAGVVKSVNRDAEHDSISGRYLILVHRDGTVKSKYIHLDRIRAGLKPGDTVRAGERVGTLGRTGIRRSAPHLHFALSIKRGGAFHYIDPEPLLYTWALLEAPTPAKAIAARARAESGR
ncbi:MAG: M23 family metallopeptidase [Myxococcales bacterium]|nr:M23 family metallopeptidase [Myxococcales bacterium]